MTFLYHNFANHPLLRGEKRARRYLKDYLVKRVEIIEPHVPSITNTFEINKIINKFYTDILFARLLALGLFCNYEPSLYIDLIEFRLNLSFDRSVNDLDCD